MTLAEMGRDATGGSGIAFLKRGRRAAPGAYVDVLVVRLRDASTGQNRATTLTGPSGEFAFPGLDVRDWMPEECFESEEVEGELILRDTDCDAYFVEVIDQNGVILSVSDSLRLAVGEIVNAVLRIPSAGTLLAAVGSDAFTELGSTVLSAATGLGVTGVGPTGPATSPEQ
ncbi:MAG: hypothetical protein QGG24_09515 [Vicinamibacterales bacterium]|nr:hypothetical protein [Vicinamibacterales bacterium]MDP7471963.1 hypothetical protein [Vicinamibacterales bacterium]MDP7670987.1 hypothetical protein [Vicinamibacterales bacterium]HJO38768.1 hypothetical protein [Vicinamibacterales bacterium]